MAVFGKTVSESPWQNERRVLLWRKRPYDPDSHRLTGDEAEHPHASSATDEAGNAFTLRMVGSSRLVYCRTRHQNFILRLRLFCRRRHLQFRSGPDSLCAMFWTWADKMYSHRDGPDKFGHGNCVMLRESGMMRICSGRGLRAVFRSIVAGLPQCREVARLGSSPVDSESLLPPVRLHPLRLRERVEAGVSNKFGERSHLMTRQAEPSR